MIAEFRADLHCHTICSDGTDSPIEVLHMAKRAGLQGLSITDHDTTAAYTGELVEEAKKLAIRLLTGVEVSSELETIPVHILGYGLDLESQSFRTFLERMQKRRTDRNRLILEKLFKKNMPISEEELTSFAQKRTIGRPHIAQLMIQKGFVSSIKEAFDLYIKEGASCYAAGLKHKPQEVIEEIQRAKGKAILAHPHFYKKGAFLRKLLDLPFDGYECHYANLDKSLEKPWLDKAHARGLIATGGSDYHGTLKPHIRLGCSWVGLLTFESFLQSGVSKSPNIERT